MIKLEYNLDIFCSKCKKQVTTLNTINEDFSQSEIERSLGYEIEYEYNFNINCENCGNNILVDFRVYEYPVDWILNSYVYGYGYSKNTVLDKIDKTNMISMNDFDKPELKQEMVEVPKDIMIGLYRILAGMSSNFSGAEVYDSAKEGMKEAYKFVIEYGNNNNINSRG